MRNTLRCIAVLLTGLSIPSELWAQLPQASDSETTSSSISKIPFARSLSVRAQEIFDKRKLRLFVVVDESDNEGRYLQNTLDARSFRLFGKEQNDVPLEVNSLSTTASKSPAVLRETAIIFESSTALPQVQFEAIRKSVAAFLEGFRSDVLSVRIGNEEKSSRLAWTSPEQSENPRAIQRSILNAEVLPGGRGLTPAICSGIHDLNVIKDEKNNGHIQRTVIVISTEMPGIGRAFSELTQCFRETARIGARVFWVRLKSPEDANNGASKDTNFSKVMSAAVEKSKGFSAIVRGFTEPTATLNNIRSYLDDEYILEFDLNNFKPYNSTVQLELVASYHGHVLKSGLFEVDGLTALPTPEEVSQKAQVQENAKRKYLTNLGVIFAALTGFGLLIWYRSKLRTHVCSNCTFVVERNFQDCPFRNPKSYGRLSVIGGPMVGKVFPLFSGDNTLGKKYNNMIKITGKRVANRHAKITLSKRKALFVPMNRCECRVNGFLLTEPRLLASGSVIRMGENILRVDFKEGE